MELELHIKETLRLREGRMCKCQLIHICLHYDFFSIKAIDFAEHQKN